MTEPEQRTLLLITYTFPPYGGVGVHRVLSLVKYFPSEGFRLHVLTTRNPSAVGADPALLLQVPEGVAITRTLTIDIPFALKKSLKKIFSRGASPDKRTSHGNDTGILQAGIQWMKDRLTPDPQILWAPTAIRAGLRIVLEEGIDTVLVSAPPFSAFLIGNAIKRKHPRVKLISDVRDEWLSYYFNTLSFNRSDSARQRAVEIERETIRLSDRVVAVTEAARQEMQNRYPEQPDGKFLLVPNGFDPSVFSSFTPRKSLSNKTLLTYVGTVYKPAAPAPLVQAISALPAAVRTDMLIRFIGFVEDSEHKRLLQSAGDIVELNGFVPQSEAVKRMEETDYLLLIWHDVLNIPGKFYDYLGTGKPILALVHPESEVWRVLHETRAGWCADVRDVSAITSLLVSAHEKHGQLQSEYCPDRETIKQYERPRLAQKYAKIIRECFREESSVVSRR